MDLISNLAIGFDAVVTPITLIYCFVGVLLGTLIGVLPGLGPVATIAMLLPATFGLPPVTALVMLAGIYYGAQYGGSTTAILVNLPGESSSVITALDGYQMARQGRGGVALAVSAIGSFVAGTLATVVIALCAPPLAQVAIHFGPAEYFALMVLGLVGSIVLAQGPLLPAFGMILVGLLLGTVGADPETSMPRFAFGVPELADGLSFVVVAMGLFGIAEMVGNVASMDAQGKSARQLTSLIPTADDMRRVAAPILRGAGIGSLLGVLPGGGAVLASFAAYSIEKHVARSAVPFGKGAIEGVAAPEAANNAGAQTSFIPMLTLGIPANPVMALMIGALIIQGIQPGPAILTEQPQLFWGIVVSMWIGNVFLVVLNLPLVGLWVRLLSVPYHLLYPAILVFCAVGAYSVSNSPFDLVLVAAFGAAGYLFSKLGCEPAPLVLAFILGPMMEENLRRALMLSRGDPTVLVGSPISIALLAAACLILLAVLSPAIRAGRVKAFQEGP